MSKKRHSSRKQSPPSRQLPWPVFVLVGALLLIIAGGVVVWYSSNTSPSDVAGIPKLVVDQTTIDEGYLTYDTPIQTAYRLRNEGDGPLKILGQPEVVLAEGC